MIRSMAGRTVFRGRPGFQCPLRRHLQIVELGGHCNQMEKRRASTSPLGKSEAKLDRKAITVKEICDLHLAH